MNRLYLTLLSACLCASSAFASHELRCNSDSVYQCYGQAFVANSNVKAPAKVSKIRPSSGVFIDEPNLPKWVAFNWCYPWTIMQIDAPDMTETNLLDADNWPVSIHLRNGNFEGTSFNDNPSGTVLHQASYALNGLRNWSRNQYFTAEQYGNRPLRTAYDEHNDVMYGISNMIAGKKEKFGFIRFAPNERVDNSGATINPLENIEVINGELPQRCECSALAWDPRDGNVIGVSISGEVIRFDVNTGDYEVLFDTGRVNSTFFGGLAFSPSDNAFVWAYLVRNEAGTSISQDFYLIDTEVKSCKLLKSVAKVDDEPLHQISSLMINEHYADPLAPIPVVISDDSFDTVAGNGTLTINIPSQSENGQSLSGQLKYYLRVDGITRADGKSYIEADVLPGSVRTDRIEGLSEGFHRISIFTVTKDGHWSRPLNVAKFVGYDTPTMPQNVVLEKESLSWSPVVEGIHGQYILSDDIEYEVWIDKVKVGTTKSCSYDVAFDTVELASHQAAVYAVSHGKISEGGFSNRITVGEYRSIPTVFVPEASDVLLASVIDEEEDGYTWSYYDYYKSWSKSYSTVSNNDWLFLPQLNFDDENALYEISYEILTGNYDETVEMYIADSVNTSSCSLVNSQTINTRKYGSATDFKKVRTIISASGVKHIAFRVASMHSDVLIKNVSVKKTGSNVAAPVAIDDLRIVPGEKGALPSKALFTFPTKRINGEMLPDSEILKVEVSGVYQSFSSASTSGKPGEQGMIIFTPQEGLVDLCVQPSIGENYGLVTHASFWAGEDVPGKVKNFKVSLTDDPMVVSISWDSPGNVGFNGGYASTDGLKYYLLVKKSGDQKWSRYNPIDYTDVTLNLKSDFAQTHTQFAVMTENSKGSSNKWDAVDITCGKAYTLPMRELLSTGMADYSPIIVEQPSDEYTGSAGYADPSALSPEYAVPSGNVIGMMPPKDGSAGKSMLILPYFSTVGIENPAFVAHALLDKELIAHVDVYATTYGIEPIKIGYWNAETEGLGYTPLIFSLPNSLSNKKWVQIILDASFEESIEPKYIVLERYSVLELNRNDLSLQSAITPEYMRVNKSASISATVYNSSASPIIVPDLRVSITDGKGECVESYVAADDDTPILPDCERVYNYTFIPDADMLGSLNFSLELPNDEIIDNNLFVATGEVEAGDAMMCTHISAERDKFDSSKISIEWNEPYVFSGIEDIEKMASFDSSQSLGGFKNIDLDKSLTYSWENWDFPGEEEPHAFIVFDGTWPQIPAQSLNVLRAHSGDKFLLALSPLNYTPANDWLVSPEVEPGSDVSFWLSSISTSYGADMVGVYASDGSENPDDFEMVLFKRKDKQAWEKVSVTLPDNARRFAIRYYSTDTFGIMIDDISYTPLGGVATLCGFELEKNGQILKSFDMPLYEYVDSEANSDEQRYRVTPIVKREDGSISKGEPSPTAVVSGVNVVNQLKSDGISVKTIGNYIEVSGLQQSSEIILSSLDGINIAPDMRGASNAIYHVESGVYCLNIDGATYNIYIR